MGCDKALMEIGGQSLLARQLQCIREIGVAEILISGRAGVDYSTFGCRVLMDKFPDAGPLAGIERALNAASSPLLLVLAVDLPHMRADFLKSLMQSCLINRGVVPRVNGNLEPLAAIYPKDALPLAKFLLTQNDFAVKSFAKHCEQTALVSFVHLQETKADFFLNCNSPGELESAQCNQAR
jgi:molybdopterin-guanine dinucleotide biosynthesis protein A